MIILRRNFKVAKIEIGGDTTENKEEVCVDLSVGESYMEAGSSENLTTNEEYFLKPGRCIIVQTAEQLNIPNDVFGFLCSKGSLSLRGFFVPNTKIDPLFSGKLDVALYNAGKKQLQIKKGMKFCSIVFQKIEAPVVSTAPRGGLRISNEKANKAITYCRENALALLALLVSALGVLVNFHQK